MGPPAPSNPPAPTPAPPWGAPRGPKAKPTCPRLPHQPGGEQSHLEQGKEPLSGCLRRICLAKGLAGASSGVCQQSGSKQSWVRRERRSREEGECGKGEQSSLGTSGMHQTQEHMETTCTPSPVHRPLHKPQYALVASFRFLCGFPREDPSAVCECGADHRACSWESRRKTWDFPTISKYKFFHSLLCVFWSSEVRWGWHRAGTVAPIVSLTRFQHTSLSQGFIFYTLKKFHCPQTTLDKPAGSSTTELVMEYLRAVSDFMGSTLVLVIPSTRRSLCS